MNLTVYRAYDLNMGRWLSRDPLRNVETDEGPNLYDYVHNNPINDIDSFGLSTTVNVVLHNMGYWVNAMLTARSTCCKNIYFMQIIRSNDGNPDLDGPGETVYGNGKPPYQNILAGGGFANMVDTPGASNAFGQTVADTMNYLHMFPSNKADFADYIICADTGKVLGHVKWGYKYKSGAITSYGAGTYVFP